MKGLILSGGSGTRLRPLTHTGPKQLIPIANKPVLEYVIDDLKEAGITEIGIILGNIGREQIKKTLGNGKKYGVKITYIVQGEPKGIAHAIATAKDFILDEPFAVYLGDNLLRHGIKDAVQEFLKSDCDAKISLTKVKNPQRFGVAEMKGNKVVRLVEKPKKPKSNLALVGIYMFRKSIFEAIDKIKPSFRNELEITDAIQKLIDWKKKVEPHLVKGWWKDMGKPEDLLEANHLILSDMKGEIKGTVEEGCNIRGEVTIDEGAFVDASCVIRGPVIIGKKSKITENTYIGPYTSIGANTIIKNGNIESSIVLEGSRIECTKRIIDSLIGRNSAVLAGKIKSPEGYKLIIGENCELHI